MVTKKDLLRTAEINTRMKYLNSIIKLSLVFFLIALPASYYGFTSQSVDLSQVSDNLFLAHIIFIGFIIAVNERIVEAFKRTYRRRTALEYANQLVFAQKELSLDPNNEELKTIAQLREAIVNDYAAETGRMCLTVSLAIGCILSSIGAVSILGALVNNEQLSSVWHVVIFDSVDVVLTGWVISGGSEGWTNVLYNARALFPAPGNERTG
ncbi:hypothetical protein AB6C51_17990 [Vibrio splendidus]